MEMTIKFIDAERKRRRGGAFGMTGSSCSEGIGEGDSDVLSAFVAAAAHAAAVENQSEAQQQREGQQEDDEEEEDEDDQEEQQQQQQQTPLKLAGKGNPGHGASMTSRSGKKTSGRSGGAVPTTPCTPLADSANAMMLLLKGSPFDVRSRSSSASLSSSSSSSAVTGHNRVKTKKIISDGVGSGHASSTGEEHGATEAAADTAEENSSSEAGEATTDSGNTSPSGSNVSNKHQQDMDVSSESGSAAKKQRLATSGRDDVEEL